MGGLGVTNELDKATGDASGGYSNNFAFLALSFSSGSGLTTTTVSQTGVTNLSLYFRARVVLP